MTVRFRALWALAAAGCVGFACSSGSGGGGGGAGAAGGGGGGSGGGTVLFSCDEPGIACTQLLVAPSEVTTEQQTCSGVEHGTPGTGCSTTGIVGCCKSTNNPSQEEQCYYSAQEATIGKGLCTGTKVWSNTI